AAQPIELLFIPAGARIIVNLKPAALWRAGKVHEGELIECLGPVGAWLGNSLEQVCLSKPEQIEEALLCVIAGPRGSAPDVVVSVRLGDDVPPAKIVEQFGGARRDDLSRPYYVAGERAVLTRDERSYVVGPSRLVSEMIEAAD